MTKLVAIVNVTPDSFSDGGKYLQADVATHHIDQLVKDGADVLDIGAESTRPGATPLSPEEEWNRLLPVVTYALKTALPVSVDTRHPQTAKRALDMGVHWMNDVTGFASDAMLDAVKSYDCRLVAMHSLGVPPSADRTLPPGCDVVGEIKKWADVLRARLANHGIDKNRMILDPGIGFGKTAEQSLALVERAGELKTTGLPVLIGHSRKSFLKSSKPAAERDPETLQLSAELIKQGIDYLRVHNVAAHRALIKGGS